MTPIVDFNLDDTGEALITSDTDYLKQEIKLMFDTRFGDLFGESGYGTDYMRFLYDLKASNSALETQMLHDLYELDLRGFIPEVKVYLLQGTERDIAVLDVTLTRGPEQVKTTYKIT